MPEFLDITHYFIMMLVKTEEDANKLNQALIGPPLVDRPTVVDEHAGFVPPSWWRGDEFASQSSIAAMMNIKNS